jgi:CTP synthase (UTP-ammonia lyase)
MSFPVRIGIIGDFTPEFQTHLATNAALEHAAKRSEVEIELSWVPTPALLDESSVERLEEFDGLWAAPGSPYKSFQGMLNGIEFARSHDWPFVGT